jgi:hypothetical protein
MALDFLSGIFGKKPQIAEYTPVDLSEEQIKALQGDIEAWPQIQQLGSLYQQYMLGAYEKAIPGFKDILALGGKTTQQMLGVAGEELAGEIPEDVKAAVQRSSAFQSLMGGTAGSGMAGALTARDLGLTSLNLIQQGAQLAGQAGNAAQRWAALSGAQLPQGMLVTPQQQAELDMQQNLIKRNVLQQKYNVAAAPDPVMKGLSDIVENLTAAYLGGKVGSIGAGNAPATAAAGNVSGAFGPQMETSFANTDASGNPMGAGGGGYNAGTAAPTAGVAYNPYNLGFNYGAGYPAANVNQYYGGTSPFTDYLNAQGFQQGAFGG